MFGASATFMNRDTESVVALAPNVELGSRARAPALHENGGADRDRTGGLLVANQALSQLSYSPNTQFQVSGFQFRVRRRSVYRVLET